MTTWRVEHVAVTQESRGLGRPRQKAASPALLSESQGCLYRPRPPIPFLSTCWLEPHTISMRRAGQT